jgi:hypothetical protein
MQRIIDHVAALVGPPVSGDDLLTPHDLDPVDLALDHDLLVGVGHRDRAAMAGGRG